MNKIILWSCFVLSLFLVLLFIPKPYWGHEIDLVGFFDSDGNSSFSIQTNDCKTVTINEETVFCYEWMCEKDRSEFNNITDMFGDKINEKEIITKLRNNINCRRDVLKWHTYWPLPTN